MMRDIKKALAGLTERDAIDMATGLVNSFNEVGLKYGEDFVFEDNKDGKLHLDFTDKDSLNLALKTLCGE